MPYAYFCAFPFLFRRAPAPRSPGSARDARRRARPGAGIVRGGASFADVLDGLAALNLDAPSDYGRALHGLVRSHLRPRSLDTILVVLGDARTNRFDPLGWTMTVQAGAVLKKVQEAAQAAGLFFPLDLPARDRRILKLYYFDGKSQSEIAEMISATPASVGMAVVRGRRKIEKILKKNAKLQL